MKVIILSAQSGEVRKVFTADYRFDEQAWFETNRLRLADQGIVSMLAHSQVRHLSTEPSGEITASNRLGVAKQACRALNELDKVSLAGASVEGFASARRLLIATIENTGHDIAGQPWKVVPSKESK